MRRFKNVKTEKKIQLDKEFSNILKTYGDDTSGKYECLTISVFDHCLSLEEAIEQIDNVSKNDEKSHDNKLFEFCKKFTLNEECYLVKLKGMDKSKVTYREFTSTTARNETLRPQSYLASNVYRFVLVLPELESVYFEGWDFTHHLYYKNEEKLKHFMRIMKENDLYIIR